MVRKPLWRLLGHDRLAAGTQYQICLRCGQREALRRSVSALAWEELGQGAPGGPGA